MAENKDKNDCCDEGGCEFRVDGMVTVDERGQMVLPKDFRAKAGIGAGEKLALVSWEKDGEVCCISLIKMDALSEMVKGFMSPMMSDLIGK